MVTSIAARARRPERLGLRNVDNSNVLYLSWDLVVIARDYQTRYAFVSRSIVSREYKVVHLLGNQRR